MCSSSAYSKLIFEGYKVLAYLRVFSSFLTYKIKDLYKQDSKNIKLYSLVSFEKICGFTNLYFLSKN